MRYLLFVVAFLISCEEPDKSIDVEYRVTGTAQTVDLTISNESGGTSQFSDQPVPWSYEFEAEKDDFVYVSAQNQGETGTVITTIFKNGKSWKSSTSEGAYVIATASGSL